jgi:site-specific DNA-methyltransferase (adenine-specific)
MTKKFTLYNDDCINALKIMDDNSIDSCVTDPPYGLSFMGKGWDYDVPKKEIWEQVFRVLKPGGHLLAFFGSRTYHRGVISIEDAGFEIRDQIMWLYGSGFPKSHDISKSIDKKLGAEREVVGTYTVSGYAKDNVAHGAQNRTVYEFEKTSNDPVTDEAKQWEGWGTALKPAHEPIVVARKPIEESNIATNVLKYGTGAINIDECRVEYISEEDKKSAFPGGKVTSHGKGSLAGPGDAQDAERSEFDTERNDRGRFPANVIHDGSDEVVSQFPNSNGSGSARILKRNVKPNQEGWGMNKHQGDEVLLSNAGTGSAARFFYCAKASKADRDEGLDIQAKMPAAAEFRPNHMEKALQGEDGNPYGRWSPRKNIHPTVKPTELMRYLCRLVTPKNGIVLDPFMGSGSTGKAAALEKFRFVGVEMTKEYFEIAEARIKHAYDNVVEKSTLNDFFS